jgi:hypothetical protein
MRCIESEKLIPLFAGNDLSGAQTIALQEHLESCARCRQLAAEFTESRDWLINFSAPDFNDATLDGLRETVMEEVGRIDNRPRMLDWLAPGWNPRFAFAATLALALLIGATAVVIFRQRNSPAAKPGELAAIENFNKQNQKPTQSVERDVERQKSVVAKQASRSNKPRPVMALPRAIVPNAIAQSIHPETPATGSEIISETPNTDLAVNCEMLRIEFQTADPNIRIIWLTPKESSSTSRH